MRSFVDSVHAVVDVINDIAFSEAMLFVILGTGILFTCWTLFGQRKALSHGIAVLRGKYDDPNDPGAINHFQALSTALSGTVGLGNIGGVALAISLGGPGAILWMWVVGLLGMAVKMTEVTLSMLYRNTDDPRNPHGGPMFVAAKGFARWNLGGLGKAIGVLFALTLMVATVTTPMFQSWNVADTTRAYFGLNTLVTGGIIFVVVGAVLLGGIKWIGNVTGTIVPFMCLAYLLAAVAVLAVNVTEIPSLLGLIIRSGLPAFLGGEPAAADGAFLGGTLGGAFALGMKRALYSSEAGQGSAPMAHAAARTDEPVREGVVAGLEPFIDTLVVCTMTALVILSTGALHREAEAYFTSPPTIVRATDDAGQPMTEDGMPVWTLANIPVSELPVRLDEATVRMGYGEIDYANRDQFSLVVQGLDEDGAMGRSKLTGIIENGVLRFGHRKDGRHASARRVAFEPEGDGTIPMYGEYVGSTLTAHAFDRQFQGLGKYLVSGTIWLFAISTIISWGYYGEQGIVFLLGEKFVLPYKLLYLAAIIVVCYPGFIESDEEIDRWSSLGLGVMLLVNIPIMLIFSRQAMGAYHDYIRRLNSGEMAADANTADTER